MSNVCIILLVHSLLLSLPPSLPPSPSLLTLQSEDYTLLSDDEVFGSELIRRSLRNSVSISRSPTPVEVATTLHNSANTTSEQCMRIQIP